MVHHGAEGEQAAGHDLAFVDGGLGLRETHGDDGGNVGERQQSRIAEVYANAADVGEQEGAETVRGDAEERNGEAPVNGDEAHPINDPVAKRPGYTGEHGFVAHGGTFVAVAGAGEFGFEPGSEFGQREAIGVGDFDGTHFGAVVDEHTEAGVHIFARYDAAHADVAVEFGHSFAVATGNGEQEDVREGNFESLPASFGDELFQLGDVQLYGAEYFGVGRLAVEGGGGFAPVGVEGCSCHY